MTASNPGYLRHWLVWTCAIVAVSVTTSLLVDPYGLYRIVEVEGLNSFKSRASQHGRQFKIALLERHKPAAIVLGNSRAEVGFDPQHPGFARAAPAVNLALPGTGIDTAAELLRHASTVKPLKIAIVGLDFVDARISGKGGPLGQENRIDPMAAPLPARWWRRLADHVDTLASIGALHDSLTTLLDNRRQDTPGLTDLGFNPMRDYTAIARRDGYHQLFLQRDRENARNYARGPRNVFVNGTMTSPYLETVRALVETCRKSGIELHLVIYPYHAHILELFHAAALWPSFEQWKRALVDVLQEETAHRGAGTSVQLWDFSGYTAYATERVPPEPDRQTQMLWYWEAGHFKKELGDLMLHRILGRQGGAAGHDAFGAILNDTTIEGHLARIREERDLYRRAHADEVLALEKVAIVQLQAASRLRARAD
jgi:hypothetical protein